VTLGQLRAIAQKSSTDLKQTSPLIISGESQHTKALYYVMTRERNFKGCYTKGKIKEIPRGYTHVQLLESKVGDEMFQNGMFFGTLSVTIEEESVSEISALPSDCLDY
jgi:hypothetical protein